MFRLLWRLFVIYATHLNWQPTGKLAREIESSANENESSPHFRRPIVLIGLVVVAIRAHEFANSISRRVWCSWALVALVCNFHWRRHARPSLARVRVSCVFMCVWMVAAESQLARQHPASLLLFLLLGKIPHSTTVPLQVVACSNLLITC